MPSKRRFGNRPSQNRTETRDTRETIGPFYNRENIRRNIVCVYYFFQHASIYYYVNKCFRSSFQPAVRSAFSINILFPSAHPFTHPYAHVDSRACIRAYARTHIYCIYTVTSDLFIPLVLSDLIPYMSLLSRVFISS